MIYICSFKRGQVWPVRPDNVELLNVTTCQRKNSIKRILSPFYLQDYKGYPCFENFYQSLKFFEGMTEEQFIERKNLWKTYKPKKTDKWSKKKCLYTIYEGKKRNYIETRKEIYYPLYRDLIKDLDILKKYKNKDVIILDYDGPKNMNGCLCLKFNNKLFEDKINDPSYPFGHGYVVASVLNNLNNL